MEVGDSLVYYARPQRFLLGLLLVLTIMLEFILFLNKEEVTFLRIILIAIIFLSLYIKFKFVIADGCLSFEVLIFSLHLYKKEVQPNQIVSMRFKRVGWARKCVIIKITKGFNLRIVHFYPKEIYNDLIDFANQYDIPISKTKDYVILEKMN